MKVENHSSSCTLHSGDYSPSTATHLIQSAKNVKLFITTYQQFVQQFNPLQQGCTNSRFQVTMATKFRTVPPNICGSSAWNWFHVTLLAPGDMKWLWDYWKICASLLQRAIFQLKNITIILMTEISARLRTSEMYTHIYTHVRSLSLPPPSHTHTHTHTHTHFPANLSICEYWVCYPGKCIH